MLIIIFRFLTQPTAHVDHAVGANTANQANDALEATGTGMSLKIKFKFRVHPRASSMFDLKWLFNKIVIA